MGLLRLPRVPQHSARSIGRVAVPAVAALAAGLGLASLTHSAGAADDKPAKAADKKVDFAKDVQPILQQSCVRCHKAPDARGGPGGAPGGPPPAGGGPG